MPDNAETTGAVASSAEPNPVPLETLNQVDAEFRDAGEVVGIDARSNKMLARASDNLLKKFGPANISAAIRTDWKWTVRDPKQNIISRIFASVSLAQYACESDYGLDMSGLNNPFGIKATAAQIAAGKARARWTKETLNGRYISIVQYFANYASVIESFDAHAELLATSGYYAKARHENNPKAFANDLTSIPAGMPGGPHVGYATGIPGHPYGGVLIQIMDEWNLYQFDAAT